MSLVSFSSGNVIKSADVNANFALCVLTDTARTVTVTHTWSASQTFSGGFTTADDASVTGAFTVSGLVALGGATNTYPLNVRRAGGLGTYGNTVDNVWGTDRDVKHLSIPDSGTEYGGQAFYWSNNAGALVLGLGLTRGIVTVGSGTVTTGASAGDVVVGNASSVRGLNNAGNSAKALIALNASDKVSIDSGALGAVFGAGAVFAGAVSGITTLAVGGAVSGVTTLSMAGALSGVTTLSMSSTLTMTASASKIVPGATSFSHRNNADSADNLLISDAGAVTVRAGLTITASGLTVTAGGATVTAGNVALTAGNLTFGAASAKIIPGATNFSIRNNGDSADNLLIADGGTVTVRGALLCGGSASASVAGFNIAPRASDPLSPADGDFWVLSAGTLKVRLNGVTKTVTVS